MRRMNRIISLIVLSAFLLNTAMADYAFGSQAANYNLATPYMTDDIAGIAHKDMGTITLAIEMALKKAEKEGYGSGLKGIGEYVAKYKDTIFNPPNLQIFIREAQELADGRILARCRITDGRSNINQRTYYAAFSLEKDGDSGFPITVYTEGQYKGLDLTRQLPPQNIEDAKAIERYIEQNEKVIDAWIRKHQIIENFQDWQIWKVSEADRELFLSILGINLKDMLKGRSIQLVIAEDEDDLPVIEIDGEKISVTSHTSEARVSIFVVRDHYSTFSFLEKLLSRKSDEKIFEHAFTASEVARANIEELGINSDFYYEIGVMGGLIPTFENGQLVNDVSKLYGRYRREIILNGKDTDKNAPELKAFAEDAAKEYPHLKGLKPVNLDTNLLTRDYTFGRMLEAGTPAGRLKIVERPIITGQPEDVRTKRGSSSSMSASLRGKEDPKECAVDVMRIIAANSASLIDKDSLIVFDELKKLYSREFRLDNVQLIKEQLESALGELANAEYITVSREGAKPITVLVNKKGREILALGEKKITYENLFKTKEDDSIIRFNAQEKRKIEGENQRALQAIQSFSLPTLLVARDMVTDAKIGQIREREIATLKQMERLLGVYGWDDVEKLLKRANAGPVIDENIEQFNTQEKRKIEGENQRALQAIDAFALDTLLVARDMVNDAKIALREREIAALKQMERLLGVYGWDNIEKLLKRANAGPVIDENIERFNTQKNKKIKEENRRVPGKSPEDAKIIIAYSSILKEKPFTVNNYMEVYKKDASHYHGFEPDISESTARRDLDGLVKEGILTKDVSKKTNTYTLTPQGMEEVTWISRADPFVSKLNRARKAGKDSVEIAGETYIIESTSHHTAGDIVVLRPTAKDRKSTSKPGKSPEDALKVIAFTEDLRKGAFTLQDYLAAYEEFMELRQDLMYDALAKKNPESTANRDLKALVKLGILKVDETKKQHRYQLTETGRAKIAALQTQELIWLVNAEISVRDALPLVGLGELGLSANDYDNDKFTESLKSGKSIEEALKLSAVEESGSTQPRDTKGRFDEKPGRSREDAFVVIALSKELKNIVAEKGYFTFRDYRIAYEEVRKAFPDFGFATLPIEENDRQSRDDLAKLDNSGWVRIDKVGTENHYTITELGRDDMMTFQVSVSEGETISFTQGDLTVRFKINRKILPAQYNAEWARSKVMAHLRSHGNDIKELLPETESDVFFNIGSGMPWLFNASGGKNNISFNIYMTAGDQANGKWAIMGGIARQTQPEPKIAPEMPLSTDLGEADEPVTPEALVRTNGKTIQEFLNEGTQLNLNEYGLERIDDHTMVWSDGRPTGFRVWFDFKAKRVNITCAEIGYNFKFTQSQTRADIQAIWPPASIGDFQKFEFGGMALKAMRYDKGVEGSSLPTFYIVISDKAAREFNNPILSGVKNYGHRKVGWLRIISESEFNRLQLEKNNIITITDGSLQPVAAAKQIPIEFLEQEIPLNVITIPSKEAMEEIAKMAEMAKIAGLNIPWHSNNRYTLLITSEFYANGEFDAHKAKYGDRFELDKVSGNTLEQFVENILAKAKDKENRTIALVPDNLEAAQLEKLAKAGIRFIRINTDTLLNAKRLNDQYREKFQLDTYAMMLLVRRIDSTINKGSSLYRVLSFYVKTHFKLDGIAVDDYIEAIINNEVARLIKGYLLYRPIQPYDVPSYNSVAATLISA